MKTNQTQNNPTVEGSEIKEKSPSTGSRRAGNLTTDISIQDQRAKFLLEQPAGREEVSF